MVPGYQLDTQNLFKVTDKDIQLVKAGISKIASFNFSYTKIRGLAGQYI